MRVAVVGASISGLVSAYVLAKDGVKVVLYEKEEYLGGHSKTVCFDGVDLDLDFMVFNRLTSHVDLQHQHHLLPLLFNFTIDSIIKFVAMSPFLCCLSVAAFSSFSIFFCVWSSPSCCPVLLVVPLLPTPSSSLLAVRRPLLFAELLSPLLLLLVILGAAVIIVVSHQQSSPLPHSSTSFS